MKKINLSKGQFAKVDDSNYDFLIQWKWHYNGHYAVRNYNRKDGERRLLFMHSVINNTPDGKDTDHINRNKLDNRKKNLRSVSRRENQLNVGLRKDNTSGYKGVSWDKSKNKWHVSLSYRGKIRVLGTYRNLSVAILAHKWGKRLYAYGYTTMG